MGGGSGDGGEDDWQGFYPETNPNGGGPPIQRWSKRIATNDLVPSSTPAKKRNKISTEDARSAPPPPSLLPPPWRMCHAATPARTHSVSRSEKQQAEDGEGA